jgi:hypothetical protein
MEDAGWPLDEMNSTDAYEQAIASLARLQQATIGHVDTLLAAGYADQRNQRNEIPEMMAYLRDAMARQTSTKVPRVSDSRLDEIGGILADACDEMEAIGLPFTLIRNDINPGNILIRNSECRFNDWAAAAVGNPFVTFEQVRVHASQMHNSQTLAAQLAKRYSREWAEDLGAYETGRAMVLAPLIAIASYLHGRGDRFTSQQSREPRIESYSRALARHMAQAIRELECGETICA